MKSDGGPSAEVSTHGVRATMTPAIVIEDVHVRYRVLADRQIRLIDLVRTGLRSRESIEVHAVRGVSFSVGQGESIGILGSNGSGKSSLLRCIAGVQPLASGRVLVSGQAQLLSVDAALDAKLSGRRNIVLGGLAMGLSRREVESRLDEVVAFAELGDAIGRPMETYSSGMRARLTFSIATMVEPPILLIDEALAVGDRYFRAKSIERINEIRSRASTVVMVTHNMNEIRATCSRAIWLADGRVVLDGATEDVITAYEDAK